MLRDVTYAVRRVALNGLADRRKWALPDGDPSDTTRHHLAVQVEPSSTTARIMTSLKTVIVTVLSVYPIDRP